MKLHRFSLDDLLDEEISGQTEGEVSETLGLVQKLRAMTDENLYLERHLETLVREYRPALPPMRSKRPRFRF